MTINPEVAWYYEQGREPTRLASFPLEEERTRRIISTRVPDKELSILERISGVRRLWRRGQCRRMGGGAARIVVWGLCQPARGRRPSRGDRRDRGESRNRPRLGETDCLCARLRAGHQPRRVAKHGREQFATRVEPYPARGSAVRRSEGGQPRLAIPSHSDTRRHTGPDRHRDRERRSRTEPTFLTLERAKRHASPHLPQSPTQYTMRRAFASVGFPSGTGVCWLPSRLRECSDEREDQSRPAAPPRPAGFVFLFRLGPIFRESRLRTDCAS